MFLYKVISYRSDFELLCRHSKLLWLSPLTAQFSLPRHALDHSLYYSFLVWVVIVIGSFSNLRNNQVKSEAATDKISRSIHTRARHFVSCNKTCRRPTLKDTLAIDSSRVLNARFFVQLQTIATPPKYAFSFHAQ